MPNQKLLQKFASLAVNIGANVQKDQMVVVRASTETKDFARMVALEAYKAGAKKVQVQWGDDYVSKYGLEHQSDDTLKEVPQWQIDQTQYFIDEGACFISITSPIPGLNKGVDPHKMQTASKARMQKLSFFQQHMMGNRAQWTIVGAPNKEWANKVFPEEKNDDVAVEKLWDAIFKASRVTKDNDPVEAWNKHNETLTKHNKILNDYQFDYLHFKNELGTDIKIKLVENHVWAGGNEHSTKGVEFNPNIPTEETFTMPYKWGVDGKVVATKPLNYQGNLIEDFWIEFKDGKVINYEAKKEQETLKNLIEYDEGSAYLGEIALISDDSPISNAGILFFNTLFDENASCHMALGRAYPMNVEGGTEMDQESLNKLGSNHSMVHSDFMFGSPDMEIVGVTKDGKKVQIFEKGNFVI